MRTILFALLTIYLYSCCIQHDRSKLNHTSFFRNSEYFLEIQSTGQYVLNHYSHSDHYISRGQYLIQGDTFYFTQEKREMIFRIDQYTYEPNNLVSIKTDTSLLPVTIVNNNREYYIETCDTVFSFIQGDSIIVKKEGFRDELFMLSGFQVEIAKDKLLSAGRGMFKKYEIFYGLRTHLGILLHIGDDTFSLGKSLNKPSY